MDLCASCSKYAAGAANYHANTGKTLPGRTTPSRFTKRQREKLRDEGNEQLWAGKVLMGNPPQACFVDFDTGSGDFWIPADDIANGFNTYRPSQSSVSLSSPQRSTLTDTALMADCTGGPRSELQHQVRRWQHRFGTRLHRHGVCRRICCTRTG